MRFPTPPCIRRQSAGSLSRYGSRGAVVSDALTMRSIIDAIRLSEGRGGFATGIADIDVSKPVSGRRGTAGRGGWMIRHASGVFSMDGSDFAPPEGDHRTRGAYEALVMVDDCHATGFIGPGGRGTPARAGVNVDVLTGTFGKALGGSIGGYTAGPGSLIEVLRQRSRPYLFSNALPPAICAAAIEALRIVEGEEGDRLRKRLFENAAAWRAGLEDLGFDLLPGEHPIIPVMTGDAATAQNMAARLFDLGIYVAGFFYPVVPEGAARIRTQMSSALTRDDLDRALVAFRAAGRETGLLA